MVTIVDEAAYQRVTSGGALATRSVATLPAAPVTFSTTTACPGFGEPVCNDASCNVGRTTGAKRRGCDLLSGSWSVRWCLR